MLIQAAANEWKVPASECSAEQQHRSPTSSGKKATYGKLAEAAAKLEVPKDVKLKDPKDWKIAGKPLQRLDTADKVTGKMVYGIDVKLPGMLNAAIRQCPVFGGKVKSFDAAKVASMPGVKKVVQVGDNAVAVGRRHVLARQDRARCAADRMGHRRQREGVERDDRRVPQGRPRRPKRPSSATRTATSKPPSTARPRRSRRSTPIRTRTTRRWSR